jgi:hypothetical protein
LNSLVGTFGNTMVMGPGQLALDGTAGVSSIGAGRKEGGLGPGGATLGNAR